MATPPHVHSRMSFRNFRQSVLPPLARTDATKESRANVLLAAERTFVSWVGGMVIPLSFLGTALMLFFRGGFSQAAGVFIEWAGLAILAYSLSQLLRRGRAIANGTVGPFFDVLGPVFSTFMLVFAIAVQQYYNTRFVPTRNIEVV